MITLICLSVLLLLFLTSTGLSDAVVSCGHYELLYRQIDEDLEPWASGRLSLPDAQDTLAFCREKRIWYYVCLRLGKGGLRVTWIHEAAVETFTLHSKGFLVELQGVAAKYGADLTRGERRELDFILFMGDNNHEQLQHVGWQGTGLPSNSSHADRDRFQHHDYNKDGRRLPIILSYHRAASMPFILIPYSPWFRCRKKSNEGQVVGSAIPFDEALILANDLSRTEWSQRKPVALGRQSNFCPQMQVLSSDGSRLLPCARTHLEQLSRSNPDLLDVAFPGSPKDRKRREAIFVHPMNQSRWKYLVMTDGWTVRTRMETHMLTESVVFIQNSPLFGYWFKALRPWVDFVPFYHQENDILERIKWLRENDERAREIGKNGRRFAETYLHRGARECYYGKVFTKLGELFQNSSTATAPRPPPQGRDVIFSIDEILVKINNRSDEQKKQFDC